MAEGVALEDVSKDGGVEAAAKRLSAARVLRAARIFGGKAARALVDAAVIYLPTAFGASVGSVPGVFIGAWVGAQILKGIDRRRSSVSSEASRTSPKGASEELRGRRFTEAAMMFGKKTANTLIDAGAAAVPPMLGALIGNAVPLPGAREVGALIGAWLSAQWLRKIRAKRTKNM